MQFISGLQSSWGGDHHTAALAGSAQCLLFSCVFELSDSDAFKCAKRLLESSIFYQIEPPQVFSPAFNPDNRCASSPDPWSRRYERHPAGSGGRGWGQSGLLTAHSYAGRRSPPCGGAALSRSAAGDQTSDCGQTDTMWKTHKLQQPASIFRNQNRLKLLDRFWYYYSEKSIFDPSPALSENVLNLQFEYDLQRGRPCGHHADWNSKEEKALNTERRILALYTAMRHSPVKWNGLFNDWEGRESFSPLQADLDQDKLSQ